MEFFLQDFFIRTLSETPFDNDRYLSPENRSPFNLARATCISEGMDLLRFDDVNELINLGPHLKGKTFIGYVAEQFTAEWRLLGTCSVPKKRTLS